MLFAAPSGAPTSVRPGTITPNSITVHWEEVPCAHRNGQIIGYRVHVTNNGTVEKMVNISSGAREATVSRLIPATQFELQQLTLQELDHTLKLVWKLQVSLGLDSIKL